MSAEILERSYDQIYGRHYSANYNLYTNHKTNKQIDMIQVCGCSLFKFKMLLLLKTVTQKFIQLF